ncbi:MAG TPA: hypothetical protein VF129_05705 [Actinomycetota bacterium]
MSTVPSASFRVRGIPAFGFAAAGLLIGYGVSYLVAVPDPHHRDLLIDRTGHAYLPAAGQAAIVLALAAVAVVVARAWTGRRVGSAGLITLVVGVAVVLWPRGRPPTKRRNRRASGAERVSRPGRAAARGSPRRSRGPSTRRD